MQEDTQQAQLRKMRRIATGLLVLMALVFVAAKLFEARYSHLGFVRAFAEAAMIGALADWFAVTALFKRPLGLPIPHTAIIQNNKDRIGDSIADFLEHNFMTREVMSEEVMRVDFVAAATHWLQQSENSRTAAQKIVGGIPVLLHMIEDEDAGHFVQQRMAAGLQNVKLAPIFAALLSIFLADKKHQILFDHVIDTVADVVEKNHPYIRQKIHEQSPRWLPKSFDEKLFERLLEGLQSVLGEMKLDDSEWRGQFQQAGERLVGKLRDSPEYEEKIASLLAGTLGHPSFRGYAQDVWRDVKQRLLKDVDADDSRSVVKIDQALRAFSLALQQDRAVSEKLNQWLRIFAIDTIVNRRGVIAGLVKRVIQKWDGATISRKFELQVGRDLQFIRINGTLVGGMVGLMLHAISFAL